MPDSEVMAWFGALPFDSGCVMSLLGTKPSGLSEFSFYSFRGEVEDGVKPTLQEWSRARFGEKYRFLEYPTVDGRPISGPLLDEIGRAVESTLAEEPLIILDSGGEQRTSAVARHLGFTPPRQTPPVGLT